MDAAIEAQPTWDERLADWRRKFRHYREPPDEATIQGWIDRFDNDDQKVAAKVLDHVKVVSNLDIIAGYREALAALPGWNRDPALRSGNWYFVGFGRAHESGAAMVRTFCEANDMAYAAFADRFKTLTDLPHLRLTAKDHVVFIDDFAGTGRQVTRMWPRIAELVASEAKCYLILTALTQQAQDVIQNSTELQILARYVLGPEDALFDEDNASFTDHEKNVVEKYCTIADPKWPKGFGDMGLMFVLQHKSANNCLPILYINEDRWRGLFPRYLRAA